MAFDYFETIGKKNYELPECSGYYPIDQINMLLSGESDGYLPDEDYISPSDFRNLSEEAQKGYRYFEYTEPFGAYDTIRRIKRSVEERIYAFNEELRYCREALTEHCNVPQIEGSVRVVIHVT